MKPFDAPRQTLGDLDAATGAALLAAASDLTLVLDADGIVRDMALGSDDLGDAGCEAWVGRHWRETVTVESRAKVEALLRGALAGEPPHGRQVDHPSSRGPDLPLVYVALRVAPRDQAAAPRVVAFARDMRPAAGLQQRLVDAQRAMEREHRRLRDAETRYHLLSQVGSEAVLIVDAATQKIVEANPAAQQFFGDAARRLVGSAFPLGFDAAGSEAAQALLAAVRAGARTGEVHVALANGRGEALIAATLFRQENHALFLLRLAPVASDATTAEAPRPASMLHRLVQGVPDGLVATDVDGRILSANAAFVELSQLANEDQARGESLGRWLGRTGVDLSVLVSNLRQRGSVRLFATTLRGEQGASTDVEISAARLSNGDQPFLGFTIRDVGRRLGSDARLTRELPQSVGQLTELVGRVPLKDIVGETTDLIEHLCIEAALELTNDNRAAAAEMLGLSRQSLYVKMRRFGLGDLLPETEK